jgi:hypothetical protein
MGQSLGFQLPPNFYQFGGQQGPIIIRQHGQPDGMFFQAAPQPTIAAQPGELLCFLLLFNFITNIIIFLIIEFSTSTCTCPCRCH